MTKIGHNTSYIQILPYGAATSACALFVFGGLYEKGERKEATHRLAADAPQQRLYARADNQGLPRRILAINDLDGRGRGTFVLYQHLPLQIRPQRSAGGA